MNLGYHYVLVIYRDTQGNPVDSTRIRRQVHQDTQGQLWLATAGNNYAVRVKEIRGQLVAVKLYRPPAPRNPVDDHYTPHPQGLHRVWVKTIYGDKLRLYRPDGRPVTDPDRPYHHLEK